MRETPLSLYCCNSNNLQIIRLISANVVLGSSGERPAFPGLVLCHTDDTKIGLRSTMKLAKNGIQSDETQAE